MSSIAISITDTDSSLPAEAREFEERVRTSLPCSDDMFTAELTSGLSVHSGTGLVGIMVIAGN